LPFLSIWPTQCFFQRRLRLCSRQGPMDLLRITIN
jgi:hypothetical protein